MQCSKSCKSMKIKEPLRQRILVIVDWKDSTESAPNDSSQKHQARFTLSSMDTPRAHQILFIKSKIH